MQRRRLPLLVVVTVALVLSACRREDNSVPDVELQDRIIATASLTDDPTQLLVTWFPAPCETFDQVFVELDEQFANLRIQVTVDITNCPPAGATETFVNLGEPLGERQIWDRAFGDTVALG